MSAILDHLRWRVLGAADLRLRLGVSPATLMRGLRREGPEVIRIGRGRATRYGLRQSWPTLDASRFPLFRVGETGSARSDGEL
ncbi:MAG: transcriptional regulator, partial [Acidobacteriota bacterium]|nr:transcriptional regulator [Acidobacteriota bacterium]